MDYNLLKQQYHLFNDTDLTEEEHNMAKEYLTNFSLNDEEKESHKQIFSELENINNEEN